MPSASTLRAPALNGTATDSGGFMSLLAAAADTPHRDGQNAGAANESSDFTASKSPSPPRSRAPSPPGAAHDAAQVAPHRRPSSPAASKAATPSDPDAPEEDTGQAKAAGPAAATARSSEAKETESRAAAKRGKARDKTDAEAETAGAQEAAAPAAAQSSPPPPPATEDQSTASRSDSIQPVILPEAGGTAAAPREALAAESIAAADVPSADAGLAPEALPAAAIIAADQQLATATQPADAAVAAQGAAAATGFADVLAQEGSPMPVDQSATTPVLQPPLLSEAVAALSPAPSQAPVQFAASADTSANTTPLPSPVPLASAAPNGSIAPGLPISASLAAALGSSAETVIVESLPRTGAVAGGDAPSAKPGVAPQPASIAGASFGSAALPGIGIPALAAALLGGNEERQGALSGELADNLATLETMDAIGADAELAAFDAAETVEQAAPESHAGTPPATLLATPVGHSTSGVAAAAPPAARHGAPLPHLPGLQILPSLAKAAMAGGGRFNIQLHPEDLGRVRVELDIGHDGRVTASITAAHPETLELLRRDAGALQQALNDAGLNADGNALSFNLQGDGQDMAGRSGRSQRANALVPAVEDPLADETGPAPASAISLGSGLVAVDIRI